jgi:hypothetical protein
MQGTNGDPTQGSLAPKRLKRTPSHAKALKVPVPMGTIVKSKKGKLLAELLRVGDSYCVCQGGAPGRGVVVPKKAPPQAQQTSKAERRLQVRHTSERCFDRKATVASTVRCQRNVDHSVSSRWQWRFQDAEGRLVQATARRHRLQCCASLQVPTLPASVSCAIIDLDLDGQYIAISACWTLTCK